MAKKPKKPASREYLESILDEARKLMPGWMFAVIHQAALPRAGGNAARNRRISAMEKSWIEGAPLSSMTDSELLEALEMVGKTAGRYKRCGFDVHGVSRVAKSVEVESKMRGLKFDSVVVDESAKFLPAGSKVDLEKGFHSGEPEGGMHAHGLDRRNSKTVDDGRHTHIFVLPGSGEVFVTDYDGAHAHEIDKSGNATKSDGRHSHTVGMPNSGTLETKLGGDHAHELMVETSGFGGLHKHIMKLEDGTELESLSPGEFVARFIGANMRAARPIYSSLEVSNAINRAQSLREELDFVLANRDENGALAEPDFDAQIEAALAELAMSGAGPDSVTVRMEVDKVRTDGSGAMCKFADGESLGEVLVSEELPIEPGDVLDVSMGMVAKGFSRSAAPHTEDEARNLAKFADRMEASLSHVNFHGREPAKLVFVSASPSPLEMARKEALIGADGELFAEKYLGPMGLTKADVATGFAIPVACDNPTDAQVEMWRPRLLKALEAHKGAKVVALGRVAKKALGDLASFSMPHPAAVRRHGDRGEVGRKVKTICKALDIGGSGMETLSSSKDDPSNGDSGANLADSKSELSKDESRSVAVTKSIAEKRIVYGVILDPYQVDAHNDWLPPAEIESTAHDFMSKSRVVGLQHKGVAEAEVVESWVEVYPNQKDRELALQNLPHRAYRRQFGNDTIHSGAWLMGVKLSEELWAVHEKGELDAFSIGGFSFKTQISIDAMPEVEFIDLKPAA